MPFVSYTEHMNRLSKNATGFIFMLGTGEHMEGIHACMHACVDIGGRAGGLKERPLTGSL